MMSPGREGPANHEGVGWEGDRGPIGVSVPNIDAIDSVTGRAKYAGDVRLPGVVYAKVVRSPIPHARIVGINTSAALETGGVVAVLTGADCPDRGYGPAIPDEHILAKEKVRFAGDEVAIVVAVDEDTAEEASDLVHVEYDPLPCLADPAEAMEVGACLVHGVERNIAARIELARGDTDEALGHAYCITEHEYRTPLVYHAYIEANAATADIDASGRITLYTGMQDPVAARRSFAAALGIEEDLLRVVQMNVGGGFGGKLQPKAPLLCAFTALRTGRAVRLVNTRRDDFLGSQPRVPMTIRVKLGGRKDGTITAKQLTIIADNGAYSRLGPGILSTALYRIDALYPVPNVRAVGQLVYTNKMPTAAFRGFGNAQTHFAVECEIDEFAEALGLDPLEVRRKNFSAPGSVNPFGWQIGSCGVEDCVDRVASASRWTEKRAHKASGRGIGAACCVHVSGNRGAFREFEGSSAMIRIDRNGTVFLFSGEADVGQGARTVFAQIVAETVGVSLAKVRVVPIDTDTAPFAIGTYASRVTYVGGNAVRDAARKARDSMLELAAEELDTPIELLCVQEGRIWNRLAPERETSVAAVVMANAFRTGGQSLTATGHFRPDVEMPDETKQGNISGAYPFAAQVAEVEVDRETGQIKLHGIYAAHDLGRAINPVMSEGQIEGGIAQGIGWALFEELKHEDGHLANDGFLDYLIPTVLDIPTIEISLVESNEPTGPFGAKALGEPTLIPTAPAIANAIYHAVGVRMRELPITSDKVLASLRALERSDLVEGHVD
ncbi:MAG: molybdopterin-dependent oxidoreductase [Actinobacteria bacterium]|nr:molybdopterin-dependent oxidoreductase [Actinomycetota bacterium]